MEQRIIKGIHIPSIRLVEEIGRGRYGVVFRGLRKGESFAVKVHRTDAAENNKTKKFLREAAALARIRHPRLPAVMAVGESEGHPYLVMEYVDGSTLASRLEDGPLSEAQTVTLARALADVLSEVHHYGLVHRDLKPQNVLFDGSCLISLIDFGFVTHTRKYDRENEIVGTLLYSAPEQLGILKRPVDGRSDLYSLGVVLFEAVTGTPPFNPSEAEGLLHQHATMTPPNVRTLNPTISQGLAAIIDKLLAKDPDDRYQSAVGLTADLYRLKRINKALKQQEEVLLDACDSLDRKRDVTPIFGRVRALIELKRAWSEVNHGKGRVGLVKGLPGSGKSRLIRELLRLARAEGALVLSGKCSETAITPFSPLRTMIDEWIGNMPQHEALQQLHNAAEEVIPIVKRFTPRLASIFGHGRQSLQNSDTQDRFYDALCEFILGLCHSHGPTLLFLDDVQWMDEASLKVIERLALRLQDYPLFLIGAARNETAGEYNLERLSGNTELTRPLRLVVDVLDDIATERLIAAHLGIEKVDPSITHQILAQSQGNAFAIEEFLNAMLDNGVLLPAWGAWIIDPRGLNDVSLPENVLQLIFHRLSHLTPMVRRVIVTAALLRTKLQSQTLAAMCEVDEGKVSDAIAQAVDRRILTIVSHGEYAFVHDRVRDTLLATLAPEERQDLHRQIAHALDSLGVTDHEHTYALADHYYLSGAKVKPERIYETNVAAGTKAMREYAFDQAYVFYSQAVETAQTYGITTDAHFEQAFGESCLRTGRMEEAVAHCKTALYMTSQRVLRARLRLIISKIHFGHLDMTASYAELEHAFTELGRELQRANVVRIIASALTVLQAFAARRIHLLSNPVQNEDSRIHLTITQLYEHASEVAYFEIDWLGMVQNSLCVWNSVMRLGPSRELAEWYGFNAAILVRIYGTRTLSRRLIEKAIGVAELLADPVISARCKLLEAFCKHWAGDPLAGEQMMRSCLQSYGRWLDNAHYLNGCADLAWNLLMRGHARDAWHWIEEGLRRTAVEDKQSPLTQGHTYHCYAGPVLAFLDRAQEGRKHLDQFHELIMPSTDDRWRRAAYLAHNALFYVERRELGELLERTLEAHRELHLPPNRIPINLKHFYVAQAWGRLLQYDQAKGADRSGARQRYRLALRELKKVASHPTIRCHQLAIEAAFDRLEGRLRAASKRLASAEELARQSDNQWILYEVSCQRARIFAERGRTPAAFREAKSAYRLAVEQGWALRSRLIRAEFGLSDHSKPSHTDLTCSSRISEEARSMRLHRSLDALLQISLASAKVFELDKLAQLALDEVLRILGAERAFLFLTKDDGETLVLAASRDTNGQEIRDGSGYSVTIVDRVRVSRKPQIVGAADEEEPLASDSIMAHSLRSILAAPLVVGKRLVGVVYLDSRLARGMFVTDDVDILLAVANHIAISVENTRAAQLKMALEAERAQRKLIEHISAVSHSLNSTLDLQVVLDRFLESVSQLIAFDQAMVLVRENDGLRIVATQGYDQKDFGYTGCLAWDEHPQLKKIIDTRKVSGTHTNREALESEHYLSATEIKSWIDAPLVRGDLVVGVLHIASIKPGIYNENDVEIINAIAGQAATAIENARLFGDVQHQATTDPLTGTYNRAQFLILGEQELSRARRYGRSVALVMFDIDNFKEINDKNDHMAGDQVLCEVTRRIKARCRNSDFVGRYGGDEFLVFLVEPELEGVPIAAEHMRTAVSNSPIQTKQGGISVTISIGVTSAIYAPTDLSALIVRADAALLNAKRLGRNRVTYLEW